MSSCGSQEKYLLQLMVHGPEMPSGLCCICSFFPNKSTGQSVFRNAVTQKEMLVVLLLLFHCLLNGTPLDWSERQWSCLLGVMDKDRQTEISEGLKRED